MADSDRSRFERQQAADAQDQEALIRLLAERARVEGKGVYFECLQDRLRWNRFPPAIQDLAIVEAGQRLGESFAHVETKVYECAGISHRIATFVHLANFENRRSGALLNLLPGGRFIMGAEEDENGFQYGPVHEVMIRRPFLLGLFAVSQIVWDRIGGEDQRHFTEPDLPIDGVSWDNIQTWLEKAGGELRLPSEAEWEYACRASSQTKYFWGDHMDDSFCWDRRRSEDRPEHSDKTNAFGLVDMSGHVGELCQDKWVGDYSNGPNNELPREPASAFGRVTRSGSWRVVRGGNWQGPAVAMGSAFRDHYTSEDSVSRIGFRVARDIDP